MRREEIDRAIQRHAPQEPLYDQPYMDKGKSRVTGLFTVEAVPALLSSPWTISVRTGQNPQTRPWPAPERQLARANGATNCSRPASGARPDNASPFPGTRWLHAEGETRFNDDGADSVREDHPESSPQRVVASFGPEHAPLEQRQVVLAIEEAQTLVPRPRIIVFAPFQFDPEAARDIDETNWSGVTLLQVQMSADLLIDDLKKKRAGNESYWLIGQPDVQVSRPACAADRLRSKGQGETMYKVQMAGPGWPETSRLKSTRSASRPTGAESPCLFPRERTGGPLSRSSMTGVLKASRSLGWSNAAKEY